MANPKLYPARCPKCQEVVTHTLKGAHVFCPRCHTWTMARPDTAKPVTRRADKALRRYETKSMEQLSLFP